MGLDASVYCDCFERGRLRTPPDPSWGVHVDSDGSRAPATNDLDQQIAFDAWNRHACEHRDGRVIHHRLGNIATIGRIRHLLSPNAGRLPVITAKVIYSGFHAGDSLELEDVERLRGEIAVLSEIHHPKRRNEQFLRQFERQLRELAECSLLVRKPIVF